MRRIKLPIILLLICCVSGSNAAAQQTPITVQNPSFETFAPLIYGGWNSGPIPSWNSTSYTGAFLFGSYQPPTTVYPSIPDGKTVAYSNGATVTQTLPVSAQAGSIYTLTVFIGHRLDGYITNYTVGLNAGATPICSQSGSNGTITAGTFAPITVSCTVPTPAPPGALTISIASAGKQIDFDNVSLTVGPPPPLQISFPGGGAAGGTGFTASFPIANAGQVPTCTPADGACTLQIQITLPDGTVVIGSSGAVAIVKTTSAQTLTVPIVTVAPGP